MEDGTGEHIHLNIVTTGRISRMGGSSSATPGRTTELSELTWNLAGNGYDYASNRPHPQHSAVVHRCYRRTCRCGRTFPPLWASHGIGNGASAGAGSHGAAARGGIHQTQWESQRSQPHRHSHRDRAASFERCHESRWHKVRRDWGDEEGPWGGGEGTHNNHG